MPYKNMPASMQDKMEKCVKDVQAKGKTKQSAIAICYTSLMHGKASKENRALVEEFLPTDWLSQLKAIFEPDAKLTREEICHKAITDAPNLRGEDAQNCWNCALFKSLPETHLAEEVTDTRAEIAAPSDVVETSSGRGICTAFDFETDIEWVCDGWEEIQLPQGEMMPEEEKSFTTYKQADGKYRWVLVSSNSFQDRDKEIVSQAALEADTERMNATKEFGTLDWWHTPIRLGVCDFSAMHGRMSIESGTFDNQFIAEKLSTQIKELAASRSFRHPKTEPDAQGVYHNIQTFARAILPRGSEANQLTQIFASQEKQLMDDKKKQALVEKLGNDEKAKQTVDALLASAEGTEKSAIATGVAHKEEKPATAPEPKPEPQTEEEKRAMFVADFELPEFKKFVEESVKEALQPILVELAAMKEAQATAVKESTSAVLNDLNAKIAETQKANAAIDARLKDLEGIQPRGYRASQDSATAITDKEKLKALQPSEDPKAKNDVAKWMQEVIAGQQVAA